jgi:hypothetical protein
MEKYQQIKKEVERPALPLFLKQLGFYLFI